MFEIQLDKTKLHQAMALAPKVLEAELSDAADHLRRKFFKTLPTMSGLRPRSRGFFRVFKGFINRSPNRLGRWSFRIVTYWKGAKVQEYGGAKQARVGKYMAIPIGGAKSASGQVLRGYRKGPRGSAEDFVPLRRHGKLILYKRKAVSRSQRRGMKRRDTLIPMFLLLPETQLNPKLMFRATWDSLASFRDQRLSQAIERTIAKVQHA